MADIDSRLPIRGLAVDLTTELADSLGTTINPAKEDGNLLAAKNDLDKFTFTATRLLIDGSGVTQPVSGTFWQATQPVSAVSLPLPTGASTETTLAALSAKFNSLGQKTMAASAPVVIASDQSSIPVSFSNSTVETVTYNTASAVAVNASNTQTLSPGSTILLDRITAAASGQTKIEIQWGTTGSETSKAVFFTSKGNLTAEFELPNPVSITNTMSIKVIRTNIDNEAMDVYSTIYNH